MNAISTELELVLIRTSIRPFRKKREGSTLSTDCHELNYPLIGHKETNSTAKGAPCEPSHQTKTGFPHDRKQRTKGWSCLNHNLDMGAQGLRKNSRTTRPRNREQEKCGHRPGKEPHENKLLTESRNLSDKPHGLSLHPRRHRPLGHLISGVTTT